MGASIDNTKLHSEIQDIEASQLGRLVGLYSTSSREQRKFNSDKERIYPSGNNSELRCNQHTQLHNTTMTTSLGPISRDDAQDEEKSQRVLTHMNQDHVGSMKRFLEYYMHANDADDVRLINITLNSMTIAYTTHKEGAGIRKKEGYVLIDPPMKSWSEVRERVVAMDAECTAALTTTKHSTLVIDRYRPPSEIRKCGTLAFSLVWFAVFGRKQNFGEGTFFRKIQPWMLYLLIVGHSIRLLIFAWTRLRKYQVRVGSVVWWMWVFSQFVEGAGCQQRFDSMVAGLEKGDK